VTAKTAKNREKIAKKSRKNREKIAKKSRKNREKIAKKSKESSQAVRGFLLAALFAQSLRSSGRDVTRR